jgi:hypothetical protein
LPVFSTENVQKEPKNLYLKPKNVPKFTEIPVTPDKYFSCVNPMSSIFLAISKGKNSALRLRIGCGIDKSLNQ